MRVRQSLYFSFEPVCAFVFGRIDEDEAPVELLVVYLCRLRYGDGVVEKTSLQTLHKSNGSD